MYTYKSCDLLRYKHFKYNYTVLFIRNINIHIISIYLMRSDMIRSYIYICIYIYMYVYIYMYIYIYDDHFSKFHRVFPIPRGSRLSATRDWPPMELLDARNIMDNPLLKWMILGYHHFKKVSNHIISGLTLDFRLDTS